jgi:hypothetical protein
MEEICNKCKRHPAEYMLEITLMPICKRCYMKILNSRIRAQTKLIPWDCRLEIHPISFSFFSDNDCDALFEMAKQTISAQGTKSAPDNHDRSGNAINIIIATKEATAIIMLSYLSQEGSTQNEYGMILKEIKTGKAKIPYIQFSVAEVNILMEDKQIALMPKAELIPFYDMLKEIEKTHKDASSGLSKSMMQLSGYMTVRD